MPWLPRQCLGAMLIPGGHVVSSSSVINRQPSRAGEKEGKGACSFWRREKDRKKGIEGAWERMFGMPNVAPCQSIAVTIWRAVQRTLEWSMKDTPIMDMAVMFEEDACFGGQLEHSVCQPAPLDWPQLELDKLWGAPPAQSAGESKFPTTLIGLSSPSKNLGQSPFQADTSKLQPPSRRPVISKRQSRGA